MSDLISREGYNTNTHDLVHRNAVKPKTMTGITKGSCTGVDMFCKSQLITCNRVKECNGVFPFEDALKHADKRQTMNIINHDRDWIIGCIEHDGFIKTHRFDKANQIILDALQFADRATGEWVEEDEYGDLWVCDQCGFASLYRNNYCQNCGARMKGADNE